MRELRTNSLGDLIRGHIFRDEASHFLTPTGLVAKVPSSHTLHLQPPRSVPGAKSHGLAARVRWNFPKQGLLSSAATQMWRPPWSQKIVSLSGCNPL